MAVKLVKIGNSKGVRIPKDFLHGYDEETSFKISRSGDKLILSPQINPRAHWVKQMTVEKHGGISDEGDDFIINSFDQDEWEWK